MMPRLNNNARKICWANHLQCFYLRKHTIPSRIPNPCGQRHPCLRAHDRHSHAKDRGCTKPGRTAPGYWTQAHHCQGFAETRRTHIDELTLACGPDNLLAETGWTTRKNAQGDTEWIPAPHLDHGQPRTA